MPPLPPRSARREASSWGYPSPLGTAFIRDSRIRERRTGTTNAMPPKNRPPTAPGEMLLEEFLKPRGVTQVELASRMGVPIQRVNTIVNGKRGVTAETAILLA